MRSLFFTIFYVIISTSYKEHMTINFFKLRLKTLPIATFSVVTCVIFFGGLGWIIDLLLDKKPIFFIIGMTLAFVCTNALVIYLCKKFNNQKKQK